MNDIAPNTSSLIGEVVGARLINKAGSLISLAKYPASTIQILGAEKALFRALKSRKGNTPKYGLIFNSSFIGRAKPQDKGRISRYLSNKCAIAARIDAFYDYSTHAFGKILNGQVEERLNYYSSESGVAPEKNEDIMKKAMEMSLEDKPEDFEEQGSIKDMDIEHEVEEEKTNKKRKRKSKKEEPVEQEEQDTTTEQEQEQVEQKPKKKRKKSKA